MEENKLIVDFLNTDVNNDGTYELPKFGTIRPNGDFKTSFTLEQMKFNKDWNWIMQVVDKIESIEVIGQVFNIQIDRNKTHILYAPANYSSEKWFENLIIKESEDKLLNTYQAVVEFIKWYNQQNK